MNLPTSFSVANARLPQAYQQAKTALSECASIDECQDWADKAEALAAYARMADDDTLRKTCDRIQARAVRRMGELLKQIEPQKGGDRKSEEYQKVDARPLVSRQQAASDAGMSPHQAKQAIRVANIPEQEFDRQVESDKPPTVTKLAEQGTKKREAAPYAAKRPEGFAAATSLIGTVEEFAAFCNSHNPELIAAAVMSHEIKDTREHVATIDAWLDRFVVNLKG